MEIKKQGLDITFSAAARFVAKYSQRQVLAREPDYGGKVTASQLNGRWAADLISYVAQPAGEFTHILVVQDIFSRMIYTEALKSAKTQETIEAFGRIAGRANAYPIELNTDKGSEFASGEFQAMLKRFGIIYRQKEGLQDISTVDRAIATLKKTLTKIEITPGTGNWAQELQRATKAHNKNGHGHLDGGSPEDIKGDPEKQFDLQQQAARDRDTQTEVT